MKAGRKGRLTKRGEGESVLRARACRLTVQEGSWNYNFQGVKHSPTMHYSLRLDSPLEFYHEVHRPSHFLNFSNIEDSHVEADREDVCE